MTDKPTDAEAKEALAQDLLTMAMEWKKLNHPELDAAADEILQQLASGVDPVAIVQSQLDRPDWRV